MSAFASTSAEHLEVLSRADFTDPLPTFQQADGCEVPASQHQLRMLPRADLDALYPSFANRPAGMDILPYDASASAKVMCFSNHHAAAFFSFEVRTVTSIRTCIKPNISVANVSGQAAEEAGLSYFHPAGNASFNPEYFGKLFELHAESDSACRMDLLLHLEMIL